LIVDEHDLILRKYLVDGMRETGQRQRRDRMPIMPVLIDKH